MAVFAHEKSSFKNAVGKPWIYPLAMTNIAIEHVAFIDGLPGLPIKNGDFP